MTLTSSSLKSNFLVNEVAKDKKSGKTNPIANTLIDKKIARIIKPMVVGSLSKRRLMSENSEARMSKSVVNSKTSISKIV